LLIQDVPDTRVISPSLWYALRMVAAKDTAHLVKCNEGYEIPAVVALFVHPGKYFDQSGFV